jgi:hypothetical protein
MVMNSSLLQNQVVVYFVIFWSLMWKGLALWRSARLQQRNWFIVLLILNTLGLLEIIYLFRFAKHRLTIAEMTSWFQKEKHSKKHE